MISWPDYWAHPAKPRMRLTMTNRTFILPTPWSKMYSWCSNPPCCTPCTYLCFLCWCNAIFCPLFLFSFAQPVTLIYFMICLGSTQNKAFHSMWQYVAGNQYLSQYVNQVSNLYNQGGVLWGIQLHWNLITKQCVFLGLFMRWGLRMLYVPWYSQICEYCCSGFKARLDSWPLSWHDSYTPRSLCVTRVLVVKESRPCHHPNQ